MSDAGKILPDCPITIFARDKGAYRVIFKHGYGTPFVYSFLVEQPELWEQALSRGWGQVSGVESYIPGAEVWVIADPPGDPDRLMVAELPQGRGVGWVLHSVLRNSRSDESAVRPAWLASSLSALGPRQSPFLILSEPGSGREELVAAFLRTRFGADAQVEYFNPARLSAAVQMREIFGDAAGARLGGEGAVVPLLQREIDAVVIPEVADLEISVQRRLLDYFSGGRGGMFWILGSTRDLDSLAREGLFSDGLFEYLRQRRYVLPPVRKQREAILNEAERILDELRSRYNRRITLGPLAGKAIESYDWPGNWHELKTTLESSFLMCAGNEILVDDLRLGRWSDLTEPDDLNLRTRTGGMEKQLLLRAYALHGGNHVQMARALGISRGSLQYKLTKYGLQ